jgi:hypothetical protein
MHGRGLAVAGRSIAEERLRWFYTPTNHGGLPIGRMLPAQQQMAMRLVATGLSESGFVTLLR